MSVDFTITGNGWGSGFEAEFKFTNTSKKAIDGWEVEFDSVHNITSLWNGDFTKTKNEKDGSYHYVVKNPAWKSKVPPGETIKFGFNANSAPNFPVNGDLNSDSFTNLSFDREVSNTSNSGGNPDLNSGSNSSGNPDGNSGSNSNDNSNGNSQSNSGDNSNGNSNVNPVQGAPSQPTISIQDDNPKDDSFTITLNKWYGTSGNKWSLKEDGKVIYTADLAPTSNSEPQSASFNLTGRDYGVHKYEVVLENDKGQTISKPLVHKFGGASTLGIEGLDTENQALQLTIDQGTSEFTVDNLVADGSQYSVKTNNPDLIKATIDDRGKLTVTAEDSGRGAIRIEDTTTGETRYLGVRVKTQDGKIPGMPDTLAIGSVSEDSKADLGFWQDFGDGLSNKRMDARYIYLNGGPENGWRSWQDGQRLESYLRESQKLGIVPYFVYYNIPDGGESYFTDKQHIESQDYLESYAKDLKYALDTISDMAGDDPVGMVLEPDFIGYMAQNSGKRPQDIFAQTDAFYSSGVLDKQKDPSFENNLTGLVKAINYTISKNAPNVNFGWQFNLWASPAGGFTGVGIPSNGLVRITDKLGIDKGRQAIIDEGKEIAKYYKDAGILSYGADFISIDKYGLDAAGVTASAAQDPEGSAWFWNNDHWNNYLLLTKTLHQETDKPVTLWQIPVGHINGSQAPNPYDPSGKFKDLANNSTHYEDSAGTFFLGDTFIENDPERLQYFSQNQGKDPGLSVDGNKITWSPHIEQAKEAGINTILFGAGVGSSTDGVGSPPTDGYWWISQVQEYYQNPVSLDGTGLTFGSTTVDVNSPVTEGQNNNDVLGLTPPSFGDNRNPITDPSKEEQNLSTDVIKPQEGNKGTSAPVDPIPVDSTPVDSTPIDPTTGGGIDNNSGGGDNSGKPPGNDQNNNPNNNQPLGQPDYVAVDGKKDVFSFTWNWDSQNVIDKFNPSEDSINLKNFWTDYSNLKVYDDAQGNAVIDLKQLNNQTITLKGVSSSELNSDNITGVGGQSPLNGQPGTGNPGTGNPGTDNPGTGGDPKPTDPMLPTLSIKDLSIQEGNSGSKNAIFNVNLSEGFEKPVSVKYATLDGSAKAGQDYEKTTGTLTFDGGQTSQTISVAVKGDTKVESNEKFSLQLSDLNNATFSNSKATATILNDDRIPSGGTGGGTGGNQPGKRGPVVAAYYPEWGTYQRDYQVSDIPADKLTHAFYAFAKINDNGEVDLFDKYAATEKGKNWNKPDQIAGNFGQMAQLKAENPHLKTMISIGGWTLSSKFSDVALTDASRKKFAISAVDFMKEYGFDGIDIDWEYPVGGGKAGNVNRPEDKHNYTLLLEELDKQIQVQEAQDNKDYLLTIASPAGFDKTENYELGEMSQHLDWFNVMTYDYHGAWEKTTNHNAALYANSNDPSALAGKYNVDSTIQNYLNAGVSPDKIVMGAPLYGRTWQGVSSDNNGGLFQSATGAGTGSWENGMIDYKDLHNKLETDKSYVRYWDDQAKVPYVYNAQKGFFSTYEDTQSLGHKLDYVQDNGLGGMFFWDVSGDLAGNNSDSLINLAATQLGTVHNSV